MRTRVYKYLAILYLPQPMLIVSEPPVASLSQELPSQTTAGNRHEPIELAVVSQQPIDILQLPSQSLPKKARGSDRCGHYIACKVIIMIQCYPCANKRGRLGGGLLYISLSILPLRLSRSYGRWEGPR